MTARWITADVFDGLATLEDGSVDLVVTSPPFLALRSYLPADHPDKSKEIGSEATPAEFIDTLLAVTAELRRVLVPHGSLCVELGDTYAGSGGENHLYEGSNPDGGFNGSRDFGTLPTPKRGKNGWPFAKSRALIPQLYEIALAYGINPLTGQPSPAGQWRIRNVVTWARPNPPVGALGDKWRPATSDLIVACTSSKRYWDDLATRRTPSRPRLGTTKHKVRDDEDPMALRGHKTGEFELNNPAGAPLLDYWEIPPGGYQGSHYAVFPPELVVPCVKAMCPPLVCPNCGPVTLEYNDDAASLRAMRETDNESVIIESSRSQASLLFQTVLGDSDARGTISDDPSQELSPQEQAIRLRGGSYARTSDGEQVRDVIRASSNNGRTSGSNVDRRRSGPPQERHTRRQPDRESGSDASAGSRKDSDSTLEAETLSPLRRDSMGGESCSSCGASLRKGIVLDPFAGSGTTLAVATGHGHDAIGIDLDPRNADLARNRIGPFLFEEVTV